jgi:hypothetical protein
MEIAVTDKKNYKFPLKIKLAPLETMKKNQGKTRKVAHFECVCL